MTVTGSATGERTMSQLFARLRAVSRSIDRHKAALQALQEERLDLFVAGRTEFQPPVTCVRMADAASVSEPFVFQELAKRKRQSDAGDAPGLPG